jgi:bifunctional non-homologous end joining protein LigD
MPTAATARAGAKPKPKQKTAAEKRAPKRTSSVRAPKRSAQAKRAASARKLDVYNAKRDFARTPEPAGGEVDARPDGPRFIVQKHDASHLHFDFRLELDGVLLSWAVPKGPSHVPTVRRLAMRTEDHPLEYAEFEGVIPKGEYGGGTVMLWDRGSWQPNGDAHAMLKKGHLEFTLTGTRMRGRWHLVKTGKDEKAWLLFKARDSEARDEDEDVAGADDTSVATGRRMATIAKQQNAVWHSNRAEKVPTRRARREPPPLPAEEALPMGDVSALVRKIPTAVKFTNLDKILYADQGLSKAALIAYVGVVADSLLAHLKGRPLTLVRCPNGSDAHCFFQKHAKDGVPSAIRRLKIEEESGSKEDYMVIDDRDGLFAAVQLGALELHVWGSREPHLEKPDRIVFDLDPDPTVPWQRVVEAGQAMRLFLEELGLASFAMTTGGKGLHVVVPVAPRVAWDAVKEFTQHIADHFAAVSPERFTSNMSKAQRKGRIFIDYLRNGRGATAIAPYSTRARPGATVATPVGWDELMSGVDPTSFTVRTIPMRLDALKADPWAGYDTKTPISAAMRKRVTPG